MVQKTSPFIEANYGWNLGESGWNTGMDENLLKFSYMLDNGVDGVVTSLPQTPVNGTSYYLTTDNRFYFVVDGTYYSSPCPKWFTFKLKTSGQKRLYDGSSVLEIISDIDSNKAISELNSKYLKKSEILYSSDTKNTGASLVGYLSDSSGSLPTNLQRKISEQVSFRDFGAIGDGLSHPLSEKFTSLQAAKAVYPFATNLSDEIDYCAIQKAIFSGKSVSIPPSITPFYPVNLTLKGPQGKYLLNKSLILVAGVCLDLDPACFLQATQSMDSVIQTEENSYLDKHNFGFIKGGKIDCNNLAQTAINLKLFSHFTVENVQTWNALREHIKLGSVTAPSSSYEGMIRNCLLRRDLTPYNSGLVGIRFVNCGDTHISDTIIMGVREGVSGTVYDSKFDRVHIWNPFPLPNYSNSTIDTIALGIGFSIVGTENVFTQCQVDGPLVNGGSAFYFTNPNNSLLGCSLNAAGVNDLQCNGVYLDSSAYTTIVGCTFKGGSPSNRLSNDISGPGVQGSKIFGNRTTLTATVIGDISQSFSKAWVVFDGSGTNVNIKKSFNISSVTRMSVGYYRITFSTPMNDSKYLTTFGGDNSGASSNGLLIYGDARTNTYLDIRSYDPVVGALADCKNLSVDIKN